MRWRGLQHPVFWALLVALLGLFLLVPQLPFHYALDVGYVEGVGSDLPFLQGFHEAEADEHGTYRWTADGATIQMAGVGQRPLSVQLRFIPIGAAAVAEGPQWLDLYAGSLHVARLPVRSTGSRQAILLPPQPDGMLRLTLRTATFTPPGDVRQLGTPLDQLEVRSLSAGLAGPDWAAVLAWLLVAVLVWGMLWQVLGETAATLWLYAALVGSIGLAAILDPPHWAAGSSAALIAVVLAYLLALVLRAGVPPLARGLGIDLDSVTLGWLIIFCAIAFAMRYGGRLYPHAMHGDIGFHVNRFNDAAWGLIFILSKNRGVDFPYPPGPYLLIAPFTLLGLSPSLLLQLGAALVDALSALVVYAIAQRVLAARAALLAAATYVFTAATLMTTWWSFDTHIYSQFFHLLTMAALCWALEAWQGTDRRQRLIWGLVVFVLLSLVFLGHFGFLINTTLLVGLLTLVTWLLSWRGAVWARRSRWPLTLALAGAGLFAATCFYSAYIPLFLSQIETARSGGLSAVAARAPVSRALMWDNLWRAGLITHFGFFPIPLGLVGVGILLRRQINLRDSQAIWPLLALMLGSLVVAIGFAILPFITLATNSPRWLLFLAWVIALGTAVSVEVLWRRAWWGRVATVVMGAVVLANTLWIWLGPMLWRVRPPEPF